MPRNLAIGVLRGVSKVPKSSQHSKYGTKPRPGRRQSKNISALVSAPPVSAEKVLSPQPVLTQTQPVLTPSEPDSGAGQQSDE